MAIQLSVQRPAPVADSGPGGRLQQSATRRWGASRLRPWLAALALMALGPAALAQAPPPRLDPNQRGGAVQLPPGQRAPLVLQNGANRTAALPPLQTAPPPRTPIGGCAMPWSGRTQHRRQRPDRDSSATTCHAGTPPDGVHSEGGLQRGMPQEARDCGLPRHLPAALSLARMAALGAWHTTASCQQPRFSPPAGR